MRSLGVYWRHTAGMAIAFGLVATIAVVPMARGRDLVRGVAEQGRAAAIAVAVLALVVFVLRRSRLSKAGLRLARERGAHLLLHLWPVVTLTVVYPLATARMAGSRLGGVELPTFLLAVALTLPWLLQGVCMPLYRSIGSLVGGRRGTAALRGGFCAALPGAALQAVPFVLLSGLPLLLILRWSLPAIGAYWLLMVINVLFAHSLVLANVTRDRIGWVMGWSAYAVSVAVVPTWWWLPPLAGLLTQLIPLRRHLLAAPAWSSFRSNLGDVGRGLLLGAVMWGDKLLYFYRSDGDVPVIILFVASLPAVIAYNFYFVCRAPDFDTSVRRLHAALEKEPLHNLRTYSRGVHQVALRSQRDTAVVGGILVFLICMLLWSSAGPEHTSLVGAVSAVSWMCVMISIACYKLDYAGDSRSVAILGGLHLLACVVLFATPLPAAPVYIGILCADAVTFVIALLLFNRAWQAPEHTLFWRRALTW